MPTPIQTHLSTPLPRPPGYRGRFAPSPTGALHFGSLVTALASYLDARAAGGAWLVRIDDLDRTREVAGARDAILTALEAHGLLWDETPVVQSTRTERYADWLQRLAPATYSCSCSRRDLDGLTGRYPGTCRSGLAAGAQARAIRVCVPAGPVEIHDRIQGPCRQDVQAAVGDFVIRRADGPFAYQFSAVIDDAEAGITDIVRGADLLESTPRQQVLQQLLGLPVPRHAHLPLAVDASGRKLSKQSQSMPIDNARPAEGLHHALQFLGQSVAPDLIGAGPRQLLPWAIAHWNIEAVPRSGTRPAPAPSLPSH